MSSDGINVESTPSNEASPNIDSMFTVRHTTKAPISEGCSKFKYSVHRIFSFYNLNDFSIHATAGHFNHTQRINGLR